MDSIKIKNVTQALSEGDMAPTLELRRASSMVLQGQLTSKSQNLFLFPDGAGSATSYANLPRIDKKLTVVALNCPYVRNPEEMGNFSFDHIMVSYLRELRRRQPQGPYNLGGWSAGGIIAHRAAQILIQQGEHVESIVLIDSPVPVGLDHLPPRMYDHFIKCNVFGNVIPGKPISLPPFLIPHFEATIDMLHDYYATPIFHNNIRKVTLISAVDCVLDGVKCAKLPPGPDDTEGMKFLTDARTDFSGEGWEELFPGAEFEVKQLYDAHHFSMMTQMPQVQKVTEMIRETVLG